MSNFLTLPPAVTQPSRRVDPDAASVVSSVHSNVLPPQRIAARRSFSGSQSLSASPRLDASSPSIVVVPSSVGAGNNNSNNNNADPSSSSSACASGYRVFVRIRPFLSTEADPNDHSFPLPPVELRGTSECLFIDQTTGIPRDVFHFDGCFCSITHQQWENMSDLIALPKESLPTFPKCANQQDIFDAVGKPIVDAVMDGFNASVLAYGQTSSGKTYTMMGTPNNEGLIPRIARAITAEAEARTFSNTAVAAAAAAAAAGSGPSADGAPLLTSPRPTSMPSSYGAFGSSSSPSSSNIMSRDFTMEMGFFEIYNETVLDLLQSGAAQHRRRKVRVHPVLGVYVEGLTYQKVSSWSQCLRYLQKGLQLRHTAATKMNDTSSRSHAIFQLRLLQTEMTDIGPIHRRSNVHLADLAGSERIKLSAVEGDRLKESAQINLSLTTLRRVIDALIQASPTSGGGGSNSASPSAGNLTGPSQGGASTSTRMIPYRDSMLTWVLSESLGGNAKAAMVATLCPHPTYTEETFQTLQYANRAKSIVNTVVKNEDQMARMIRQLQDALAVMQSKQVPSSPGANAAAAAAAAAVAASTARDSHAEAATREQEALIQSLREEQMLMLTKYADLRETYDSLKDDMEREVDHSQQLVNASRTTQRRLDEVLLENAASKARVQQLEQERITVQHHAAQSASEAARLTQWKIDAEQNIHALEFELSEATVERDALRQSHSELQQRVDRLEAERLSHQQILHRSTQEHAHHLKHIEAWYQHSMALLWESCFQSKRTSLLSQVTSWSCDWAVQTTREVAVLNKRIAALEERLADLEYVNMSQDRALTSVASTYVGVRDFLQRLERGGGGATTTTSSTGGTAGGGQGAVFVEANWTVAGLLQSLHRFCQASNANAALMARATVQGLPPDANVTSPPGRASTSVSTPGKSGGSGGKGKQATHPSPFADGRENTVAASMGVKARPSLTSPSKTYLR